VCVVAVAAVAGVAIAGAAAYSQNQAQKKAANAQSSYNRQVSETQAEYRLESMEYQNEVWAQDVDYARDSLSWAEQEWDRQERYANRAMQAIEKNTLAATGQLLLRQVEEDMAVIMQGQDQRRAGQVARAGIAVRDRGVEGNSVDAIINDVSRQEGEVLNVMAMNRAASLRAINRQVIEADARGDQQLSSIQLKTYNPASPIRTPAPINPVNPAAPVAGPSTGAMVAQMAGGVVQGFANYSNWSGSDMKTTMSDAGNWIGRQFTVTPTGGTS
jgi:hypothetical protein